MERVRLIWNEKLGAREGRLPVLLSKCSSCLHIRVKQTGQLNGRNDAIDLLPPQGVEYEKSQARNSYGYLAKPYKKPSDVQTP